MHCMLHFLGGICNVFLMLINGCAGFQDPL